MMMGTLALESNQDIANSLAEKLEEQQVYSYRTNFTVELYVLIFCVKHSFC